jgi:hypothetical protein
VHQSLTPLGIVFGTVVFWLITMAAISKTIEVYRAIRKVLRDE